MLKSTLSAFVVVYPDDILVCSKTPEKHAKHFAEVLDTLSVHELVAQASIAFFSFKLNFLFLTMLSILMGLRLIPTIFLQAKSRTLFGLLNKLKAFLASQAITAVSLKITRNILLAFTTSLLEN